MQNQVIFQPYELVKELPTQQVSLREALRVWYVEYGCTLKSSEVLLKQMKPIVQKLGWVDIDKLAAIHLSEYRNDRLRQVGPQTVIHELSVIKRCLVYQEQEKGNSTGKVVYTLKTPYRDGTTQVAFEPADFIARLAALVPKPRVNLTRYHGVLAPNHRWRGLFKVN